MITMFFVYSNEIIFIIHSCLLVGFTVFAARLGEAALAAFISLSLVFANLFVLKQVVLFGLEVTCTDVFMISAMMGVNLMQERYGSSAARRAVWTIAFISFAAFVFTFMHTLYLASENDTYSEYYNALFSYVPRLVGVSIGVSLVSGFFERSLYDFLRSYTGGALFALRSIISLSIAQILDTTLYSFLALHGLVSNITDIIIMSLAVKFIIIVMMSLFGSFFYRWALG